MGGWGKARTGSRLSGFLFPSEPRGVETPGQPAFPPRAILNANSWSDPELGREACCRKAPPVQLLSKETRLRVLTREETGLKEKVGTERLFAPSSRQLDS